VLLSGGIRGSSEADVRRIKDQLRTIHERVRPMAPGPDHGRVRLMVPGPGPSRRPLPGYHLRGWQTDDALLGEIQAVWVEYEAWVFPAHRVATAAK
jgi:hypothetical protein